MDATAPIGDHGDSFANTSLVAVGAIEQASLGKDDKDYFKFTAGQRATYVIYTTGDTAPIGELYDADFNLKKSEGGGGEKGNFRIAYQLEKGQTYYIAVRGRHAWLGRYALHIDGSNTPSDASAPATKETSAQCRTSEVTMLARAALKDRAGGVNLGYLCQPYTQTGLGLHAHAGIDLEARKGTPVYAIAGGEVVAVDSEDEKKPMGKIMIKLADEKRLIYLHLSRIDVHKGQRVSFGDRLGLSGSKGASSPHLHIEVRINYSGKYALGGESCDGECTAVQVAEKTVDPASIIGK